jgi:hypothetical protein
MRISQKIRFPILLPPNNFGFFNLLKVKIKINLIKRNTREGDYVKKL